jgi:hypothetical protein
MRWPRDSWTLCGDERIEREDLDLGGIVRALARCDQGEEPQNISYRSRDRI